MLARHHLLVFLLVLGLAATIAGCGSEQAATEATTPSVRMPSRTMSDPLSKDDVQTFLAVLEDLPGGKVPEFEPLSQITASKKLTGTQLTDIYRQEYRAMFDASRHGERWRKDAALMRTFQSHQVQPEDFAALMMHMSCAITANTISARSNLRDAATKAESQIDRLIHDIQQIDLAPRTPATIEHRLLTLQSLQDLVAFSEFSRILKDVPEASCTIVDQYRQQLSKHLPTVGNVSQFERTIESHIVPTSYERRAPAR